MQLKNQCQEKLRDCMMHKHIVKDQGQYTHCV
jgi:hypothetical protein